jgi:hypothetical protein
MTATSVTVFRRRMATILLCLELAKNMVIIMGQTQHHVPSVTLRYPLHLPTLPVPENAD